MPESTVTEKAVSHTPGPLHIESRGTGEFDVISEGNRRVAGYMRRHDAMLFAAAPEMLQALREIEGDHILVEHPGAIPICTFCSADEGEEHEPECTMRGVLDALDKAAGCEPRQVYVVRS